MEGDQIHGEESIDTRPRRHLPDIPRGRSDHVSTSKPPELHLYDDSSIAATGFKTSEDPDHVAHGSKLEPLTSTPSVSAPKTQDKTTSMPKSKTIDKSGVKMKPATFDGSVHWADYKAHFDACAEINGWTDKEKGHYLAVSLRGQAQGVFGNLSAKANDYFELSTALQERFAPPNQTELDRVQLKERRQKATESLTELGQDIWRLTNLAYPKAPADLRETLAKEQFIDALVSSDMRLRIKQARPTSLNMAVRHAVELEAFNKAERKHIEGQGYNRTTNQQEQERQDQSVYELQSLKNAVFNMQKSLRSIIDERNSSNKQHGNQSSFESQNRNRQNRQKEQQTSYKRKCWTCGSEKHLRRTCPERQEKKINQETNVQQTKHIASTGAGLYASCKINNISAECLIDTGATLTIMSQRMWETIKPSTSMALESFDSSVFTASGEPVEIEGKTCVFIEINGILCPCNIVVAKIDVDLIVGLDFLAKHDCQINVAKSSMIIQGKHCKLTRIKSAGCYRVVVSSKTQVPAMSEMIIEGKSIDQDHRKTRLCLLEPTALNQESSSLLVARSLTYDQDKTPIRVMNLSNESKTLYPATKIATLSPVSTVQQVKEISKSENMVVPEHLKDLFERTTEGMSIQQQRQVSKLLCKYSEVFSKADSDIGRTGIIKHKIPTGNSRPIKQPPRRVPVHMSGEVDSQIDNMLKENIIQPSTSPWASSIVMVKKKDGSTRFCVDYRKLNDVTIKDAYPLPRIDESLDQLAGAKWFSCLDLNAGYWQVETDPGDREKTAFTSRKGLFEFNVMPFGLCNAPATFERLMEIVLAGLYWQVCLIYLDDIIVSGKTFEDMIENLSLIFDRFLQAGQKLKPRKCKLFAQEVEFLGHIISETGIRTDPNKTKCIEEWPVPKNVHEIRSFLGLCSYYRRFVYKFSDTAKPLYKLTEKQEPFIWSEECAVSFKKLKKKLVEAPILIHPDFTKRFTLDVDASDISIGAVLSQNTENGEYVVAYASRILTKTERRYCVTRKELLALVYFVNYFRHYLYGKKFRVRTDHSSLRWLMNFKNPEGQVARWIEFLSSFDIEIEHRPGRAHGNADGVSRIPCRQCGKYDDEPTDTSHTLNQFQDTSNTVDVVCNDLRKAQMENRDICIIKQWLESGEKSKSETISSESWFVKSLINQWERLDIQNGLLVRRWNVLGTDNVLWQAIVPLNLRRQVLQYSHDIKASSHLGLRKTLSKIRQGYYWPGLQNDVRVYIGGCEKYARRKNPIPTRMAPMQVVRSGYPMECIAIDILGELPVTENGNKYILVISDYFTKWTESFPMVNMEARTCAKILVQEVISRFGVPSKVHSDQGKQFVSSLFTEICDLLQIDKTRTTPYHPQSDGMVERFNRTLCAMLSTFIEENHRNWDTLLPNVMMAYRCTEHETTGMSPNMLMLGRETSTPLDISFEMPPSIKRQPANN